jgi:hypothetical protein
VEEDTAGTDGDDESEEEEKETKEVSAGTSAGGSGPFVPDPRPDLQKILFLLKD